MPSYNNAPLVDMQIEHICYQSRMQHLLVCKYELHVLIRVFYFTAILQILEKLIYLYLFTDCFMKLNIMGPSHINE